MGIFEATPEIRKSIAEEYNVALELVDGVYRLYETIKSLMTEQYLAHVIRTMETKLREITGNPMFQIRCNASDPDSKELGVTCAIYQPSEFFSMLYHPKMDKKQLRIYLAHELGHLFLIEFFNVSFHQNYNKDTETEPLCSIFGIFAMLDKNDFYHSKTAPFKHNSPDDIFNDFKQLKNRKSGRFNVS
jgi:Zn-dependent peptidase ImmA (M78 family)